MALYLCLYIQKQILLSKNFCQSPLGRETLFRNSCRRKTNQSIPFHHPAI